MPSPVTSVPEFARAANRAGLLADADAAVAAFLEAGRHPSDVETFRKSLVRRGVLTEFQSLLVARGHDGGFRVAGYTILDRVGSGANGSVYRARHPLGQVVALKVLAPAKSRDGRARARFDREGELLAQCDHPHVVKAFHAGQAGGLSYLVMEYLPGDTLEAVIRRRGPLPLDESVRLVAQALAGLGHLAERRIVHRDLKPANLMVVRPAAGTRERAPGDTTRDAVLKLLDVGLGVDAAQPVLFGGRLTDEGTLLGTPDYLAPEQARDPRGVDTRADIYSLGCVLYHLAAGSPPHNSTTVIAQVVQHATADAPPLPHAPASLQAVYARMTAKRPEERYATPAECAEALAPHLPGGAARDTPDPDSTGVIVLPEFRDWLTVQKPGAAAGPTDAYSDLDLHPLPSTAESFKLTHQSLTLAGPAGLTRRDALMLSLGAIGGAAAALAMTWRRR